MNKAILVPIISGVAIIVKNLTGYEVGSETQDAIVEIALGLVTLYGVWKNYRKPKEEPKQ